jgi:hypothetical protein
MMMGDQRREKPAPQRKQNPFSSLGKRLRIPAGRGAGGTGVPAAPIGKVFPTGRNRLV